MRLFVAVDVPAEWKERLVALCHGLPTVRWTPEDQMHITVRFLGETERSVFESIEEALLAVTVPPFSVRLRGVGQFLRGNAPQVLWVGVDESSGMDLLHRRVESALSQCGIAREKRRFHPHVTLGRPGALSPEKVERYMLEYHDFALEPFEATSFVLYSSRLRPEGALHTAEAVYELTNET